MLRLGFEYPSRRRAAACFALALIAVSAAVYAAAEWFFPYDMPLKGWIEPYREYRKSVPEVHALLRLIRPFGKAEVMVFIALALAAVGRRRVAWRMALALVMTGLLVQPVKLIVGRERPNGKNTMSFPSGDTATAAAVVLPVAAESALCAAPFLVAAPLVGGLRMYDNAHHLGDVAVGMVFGLLCGALALCFRPDRWRFIRMLKPRWFLLIVFGLGIGLFCAGIAKDKGKAHDFMQVFGPMVFYLTLMPYWRLLLTAGDKGLISRWLRFGGKIAEWQRRSFFDRMPVGLTVFLGGFAATAWCGLAAWFWTWETERLKLPFMGLALLAVVMVFTICLDLIFGETRKAAVRKVIGGMAALLSLSLFLAPSLIVYLVKG